MSSLLYSWVLLYSLKGTFEDEYIASLSRGGLLAPNTFVVNLCKVAELTFGREAITSRQSVISCIGPF